MARIAIIAGMAIAGAVISVMTGGLGTFAVGAWASDIFAGAAVGGAIGSIGASLLPVHLNTQPPLSDLQIMSSAPGTPIPYGYGGYRVPGQVIWADTIQVHKSSQSVGGKGGQSTTVYNYTVNAAISFGYGPGQVIRLWADSKLVYDRTGKGPIAIGTGLSNSKGVAYTTPFMPTFYAGTTTQLPDPTIQASQGIDSTPAFRNQIYIVLSNFPLADFGNRLPSFRAEVTASTVEAYLEDAYPASYLSSNIYHTVLSPFSVYIDPVGRTGLVATVTGDVVQKIDLDVATGTPADPYAPSTGYTKGAQVLDTNGNIQMSLRDFTSPGPTPVQGWQTGFGQISNQVGTSTPTWYCLGPGPTVIPITKQAALVPTGGSSMNFNGHNACLDSAGNYWAQSYVTHGSVSGFALLRYNRDTLACDKTVMIPNPPFSVGTLIPIKSAASGKNYLFCLTNLYLTVIDADGGSIVYAKDLTTAPGIPGTLSRNVYSEEDCCPVVDPATGTAYIPCCDTAVLSSGGAPQACFLVVNPIAGSSAAVSLVRVPNGWQANEGAGDECAGGAWWDGNDSTLILYSTIGTLTKINPKTGAVLVNAQKIALQGGFYPARYPKGYNCLVPGSGVLYLDAYGGTGSSSIITVRASDLTVLQTIPFDTWFSSGAGGGTKILWLAYDELSNSALIIWSSLNGSARIYFSRSAVAETSLGTVIKDQWVRSGGDLTKIDTTQVDSKMVRGYCIQQVLNAKATLQPLCQAYFFEIVESDNKLVCVPRGQSVTTVIPEEDLGLTPDNYAAIPTLAQEHELPINMMVNYYDPALDYQQSKQQYKRHKNVKRTRNESIVSLPITLHADEAAAIAVRSMSIAWAERNRWETKLWRSKYKTIDPTDVIQFTYNGKTYQDRVVKMSVGQNDVIELSAVSEDPRQYLKVLAGNSDTGFRKGNIFPIGQTVLFILDIPYPSDSLIDAPGTTGFFWYVAGTSSNWPGAALFQSVDNSTFSSVDSVQTDACTYGTVPVALPAPVSPFTWDEINVFNVLMANGAELSSDTALNVLNGSNLCSLGGEELAFRNAVLQSDGSYNVSGLLRGLRGTESWCGTHVAGETLIVLSLNGSSGMHTTLPTSVVGVLEYFRGITIGNPVTGTASQQLTLEGNDLKPYAPASFGGAISGSDIVMTWVRRTRIGGAWIDGTGIVPLSEESESYDVSIYDGSGNLKRTIPGLTSPTFTYTAAMQTADFGGTQATVHATVWQNSASVGHGFPSVNPNVGNGSVVTG